MQVVSHHLHGHVEHVGWYVVDIDYHIPLVARDAVGCATAAEPHLRHDGGQLGLQCRELRLEGCRLVVVAFLHRLVIVGQQCPVLPAHLGQPVAAYLGRHRLPRHQLRLLVAQGGKIVHLVHLSLSLLFGDFLFFGDLLSGLHTTMTSLLKSSR